jgi:diguanylate cyclase (GGDEF)-like protein
MELRDLVRRDHLTGLFNKRYFQEQLQAEIKRSQRYGQVFSILYVDIDNFKHYNDSRGHLAGDRLIGRISQLIRDQLRAADGAFRYGGEEYTVILPLTDTRGALEVAERIRQHVERSLHQEQVTVSVGVAEYRDGTDIVSRADQALYQAKEQGRNSVTAADRTVSSSA